MAGLTGIDPFDPTPAIRREYVFGAGGGGGSSPDRPVILVGNKTSAGSETVDVLGEFIVDDADAKARFGARSELYAMYRAYTAVDTDAKVYGICPTESGGSAASVELTVSGDASTTVGWEIHVHGETITYSPAEDDGEQTTAEAIRDELNAHDGGRLQVTATAAIDGAGPDWAVTVTAAQIGPRGDLIIGATANRGIRVKSLGTNAQTLVKATGAYSAGATADDWTAAIAELANSEIYYHALAAHATTTVTATDNGIGEYIDMVRQQGLPAAGKDQRVIFANVGTNAQAVAVAISSACNSALAHCFWQENSDWTPAMLAAHHCAVVRSQEIAYPAANINGYTATDNQIYRVPKPYLKADYPTATEIKTALNNGVSPLAYNGRVYLVRFITTRSLNGAGSNDYKAREGHIPSVVHAYWATFASIYESRRQPNADSDPVGNAMPKSLTQTPSLIRDIHTELIEDFTGDRPQGVYPGPMLKPSAKQEMIDSIDVTYAGGGSFPQSLDLQVVEHNIKTGVKVRETGQSY